jgi:DNA-binding IclR family transcriptional regulator
MLLTTRNGSPVRTSQSAQRALQILLAVAQARRPIGFAELHRLLGWPKGSLHALLKTLESQRFLSLDSDNGRYSIGIAAFEVGSAYPEHADLRFVATPVLEELVRDVDETCHVAVLDRGQVVYIDRIESAQELRYVAAIGRRLPAYATGVGKALLAGLTDQEILALYPPRLAPLTRTTLTSRARLLEELRRVRETGYALDDEESTPGVRCVSVAVAFDAHRSAAFSLSIPLQRAPLERLHQLSERLLQAASDIRGRVSRFQPKADVRSWNLGLPRA